MNDAISEARYEQYIDKFFEEHKPKEKGTYKSLFNKLENFDKPIVDWDIPDLEEFIKGCGSISVNTINKFLQFIKEIYRFICKENGIQPKYLYLPKDTQYYIDLNELNDVTITKMQYIFIKNLLTVETEKGTYNYRDKVLFELPWEAGLTNQELKYLRIDDIKFYNEYGKEKVKLYLKNRNVIISNPEIIEDIKKTIEQDEYYRIENQTEKSGREYFVRLKSSPCLIRPIAMRQSNKDQVANPSTLLNRALRRIEMEHDVPGVVISKLSIEDIKRSKIIDMLKDESYNIEDVASWVSRDDQHTSDLFWLKTISDVFKQKEEEYKNTP